MSSSIQTVAIGEQDLAHACQRMLAAMHELYPLCRSITGPGVRDTLRLVSARAPLSISEVPTGTQVFDWTVPREWSIKDAFLEHESGRRFAEFRHSNLHVVGYSVPVDRQMSFDELRGRLHTLPAHPDWIPFRSSYYSDDWGFCLSQNELAQMPPGQYRVLIDSQLSQGSLSFGEHVHHGSSDEEVLVFAHVCHPSLCNDNLSGIVVATELAAYLAQRKTRFTYRFVFAPATIGSIAWMSLNRERLHKVRAGIVLAMLGDGAPLRYHATRTGSALVDRAARHVLTRHSPGSQSHVFSPWGFDERQFNSPGIKLPVGRLNRALPGEFPEEHTSADSLALMSPQSLGESWLACLRIFEVLEGDQRWLNLSPCGEPQLGRRGLYRKTGGHYDSVPDRQMALLWILNQSDGDTSLLDIAERSGLEFGLLLQCAHDLCAAGLLRLADNAGPHHGD